MRENKEQKMNGTKEHQCKICEKVFASKQGLKNHFIVSHDQKGKVYNCNICIKAFQNQYILNPISKRFMNKHAINVSPVENHFLEHHA